MGLARLAEGFNPARGNGEVIYPSLLSVGDNDDLPSPRPHPLAAVVART
jgi:hypothetical protein